MVRVHSTGSVCYGYGAVVLHMQGGGETQPTDPAQCLHSVGEERRGETEERKEAVSERTQGRC